MINLNEIDLHESDHAMLSEAVYDDIDESTKLFNVDHKNGANAEYLNKNYIIHEIEDPGLDGYYGILLIGTAMFRSKENVRLKY